MNVEPGIEAATSASERQRISPNGVHFSLNKILRPPLRICAFLLVLCAPASVAQKPELPVVDGQLGRCSAKFTVVDNEQKPIYNAKIDVVIHYGFLSKRRMTLQVGTNSDGEARVSGLPESPKKPLEFDVTSGPLSKTVTLDPSSKCDTSFKIELVPQ